MAWGLLGGDEYIRTIRKDIWKPSKQITDSSRMAKTTPFFEAPVYNT